MAAAVLAAGVAACASGGKAASSGGSSGSGAHSTPMVTMNFELNPTTSFSWLAEIAVSEGFFARNGIQAKPRLGTVGGSESFAALANGSDDVDTGDLSLAGPLLEKGIGLTLLSGSNTGGWDLVAAKSASLPGSFPASIRALKGKPVGVVALGTSSYYTLQQLVIAAGLGPDGVNYTALGATAANAIAALDANRVSAVVVPPDLAYYLTQVQGDRLVFDTTSAAQLRAAGGLLATVAGKIVSGWWARNEWLQAHPGVAVKFQRSMEEADAWMHDPANFSKVMAALQAGNHLPAFEEGTGAVRFFQETLPDITSAVPGGVAAGNAAMNFWVRAGLLAKAIPAQQWMSPSIPTSEMAAKQAGAG